MLLRRQSLQFFAHRGDDALSSGRCETDRHCELIERVGLDQFGSKWNTRALQLARTVAIKIPRKIPLEDTDTEQFLREARAGAQIRHSNIVSVHEVSCEGPFPATGRGPRELSSWKS